MPHRSVNKPTADSMSMFTGASGISISHGEFSNVGGDLVRVFNNSTVVSNGYRSLWDAIAGVGASHNSQLRFPPPRCHPKTREGVIDVLLEWIDSGSRDLPVCWLSGTAGVGKSAIAQTISEIHERDRLVASFFFFRQDPKRNNPEYLMLTIAHGLVVNVPELRQYITQRIAEDPKVLEVRLKDQFTKLVVNPLFAQRGWWNRLRRLWADWPRPSRRRPNLVIIDGLDECGDDETQTDILRILASELGKHPEPLFPLRFLVCTRPEPWIREEFETRHLRHLTKHVVLDDSFSPDADIERFLRDGFREISTSPKYSQIRFPEPWPSEDEIMTLVDKARGQFIYAATILKFVKDGFTHPVERLYIILDMSREPSYLSPFQQLDDLYRVVLSANSNREGLVAILASILILPLVEAPATPWFIECLLGLPDGQAALTLRPMHSVLNIRGRDDVIVVFHTTFTDFLYDQSRSGDFYLDKRRWHDFLVQRWLHVLVERCRFPQLHGGEFPSSTFHDGVLQVLWEKWPSFCTALSYPSEQVISSLRDLDVGALLTAAISSSLLVIKGKDYAWRVNRKIPPFLQSLWEKLETITSWLILKDVNGTLSDLIEHFESARESFHVAISPDIAQTFVIWIVLNMARCDHVSILTHRVDSAMIRFMEGTFSMPVAYYNSCLIGLASDFDSNMPPRCPLVVGHYHINVREAAVSTLQAFKDTLHDSQFFMLRRGLVSNVLGSILLPLCGPDPRALLLCHQLLLSLEETREPEHISEWLESFPDEYANEVGALRRTLGSDH
ncbi:hypothetical protein E1B28_003045 [Marasmius oreades]|uniref:Nephrocystin 3-like N-terminal domain-containing protein n=1 Tax=Marasmius oreades TaxID=181124 RepID=A0A9P7RKW3_9AGAR|nr:uncharacterized protein E1B28_003045 [Marasmius oreades]KAG7085482.1 hypothetical protein E1B28_003045 [Marasmius oreades]